MTDKLVGRLLALNVLLAFVFGMLLIWDIRRPEQTVATGNQEPVARSTVKNPGVDVPIDGGPSSPGQPGTPDGPGGGVVVPTTGPYRPGSGRITFGGIYSETGPVDSRPEEHSVRAVFQDVNSKGGVNGIKLFLQARDDGFDPTKARTAAQELVEKEKVFAFVGNMAPNSETGFLPYLATKGIPVVGGLGVPQQENQPTMFLTFMAWSKQSRMSGALLPYMGGCRKTVVWLVDLPFTAPLAGPLKSSLTKANCPPLGDPVIISAVQPDYSSYVIQARQAGAEAILMALDPGSIMRAVSGIRQQNWNVPIVLGAPSNTKVEDALKNGGRDKLDGAFMNSVFLNPEAHPNAPGVKRWLGIVKKYYPNDFTDPYTQQSYVSALVTVEALRRAGPNPTWKSFIAAMESIKNFDTGLSLPMTYSKANHDPLNCMELVQRRGGRWVPVVNHWICADGSKPPLPA